MVREEIYLGVVQVEKSLFEHGNRPQRSGSSLSLDAQRDNPFYERSELYLIFKARWK